MYRILIVLLLLIPQDTLKVKVSLVSVGVRVTDSKGRNITGLKAEDFTVSDDGAPQKIEFFSSEEQPVTMGILLDHSFSMATNAKLDRAKEAAQALVRATHNGSEYFYVQFDENVKLASDFTSEPQAVLSAIEQTPLGGGTALYDAVIEGVNLTGKAELPRQILVIISDGADQHSKHRLEESLQLVRQSEIQVYTIGYFDPVEEKLYRAGSDQALTLIDGRQIDNPRIVLQKLAQESGGLAFFPRTDAELAKAVDEITNDVRSQYTLAFYPSSTETDRYHQLRVTVHGGKYTVRARPGYGAAEIAPAPARRDSAPAYESHIERRDERAFFRDDFSDHNSGWPNRQSARYVPGGYQLTGSNVVAVNGPVFSDFRASVSVKVEPEFHPTVHVREGESYLLTGAGLMFRDGYEGYYILAAFPPTSFHAGFVAAFQSAAGKTTELERWPLVRRASPDVKLEVRCLQNDCAVYQDGLMRGELKKLALTEGHLGLYLIGKGEATFHDFSAEEIK